MDCGRTIEQHLKGLVDQFPVSDETIRSILMQADVAEGMMVTDLEEEQVDMCCAYLYMWCMNMIPYSRNNTSDSDGGWSHTEGGFQMLAGDRRRWLGYLRFLFRKWQWPWLKDLLEETQDSRIRVYNL